MAARRRRHVDAAGIQGPDSVETLQGTHEAGGGHGGRSPAQAVQLGKARVFGNLQERQKSFALGRVGRTGDGHPRPPVHPVANAGDLAGQGSHTRQQDLPFGQTGGREVEEHGRAVGPQPCAGVQEAQEPETLRRIRVILVAVLASDLLGVLPEHVRAPRVLGQGTGVGDLELAGHIGSDDLWASHPRNCPALVRYARFMFSDNGCFASHASYPAATSPISCFARSSSKTSPFPLSEARTGPCGGPILALSERQQTRYFG